MEPPTFFYTFSALERAGITGVQVGDELMFEAQMDPRRGKKQATRVELLPSK